MNPFDAVVIAAAIVAVVMGYNAGLLRSLATILGYLVAAPIAVAVTQRLTAFAPGQSSGPANDGWLVLFVAFIAIGIVISALLRIGVSEIAGADIGWFDRLGGAALGAVRIFLVAVLVVVIFDRLIPPDRQPQFLAGSRLRPFLSAVGQRGLRSLPPEVEDYIDRIKRDHGL